MSWLHFACFAEALNIVAPIRLAMLPMRQAGAWAGRDKCRLESMALRLDGMLLGWMEVGSHRS